MMNSRAKKLIGGGIGNPRGIAHMGPVAAARRSGAAAGIDRANKTRAIERSGALVRFDLEQPPEDGRPVSARAA